MLITVRLGAVVMSTGSLIWIGPGRREHVYKELGMLALTVKLYVLR